MTPDHRPSSPPPVTEESLLRFLQDHATAPPPPAPELEDRIMQAIQSEEQDPAPGTLVARWRQRTVWLPAALAAGITVLWISVPRLLSPEPVLTMAEQAELEMFLESAWSGVIEEPGLEDLRI